MHFTNVEPAQEFYLSTTMADTPIAGTWTSDSVLSFRPAVPLRNATNYRLMLGDLEYLQFTTPASVSSPKLQRILPDRDMVPSNLLKINLVFSEPMTESGGIEALSLFDLTDDKEIQNPFLSMSTELWNTTGDTLTVWIDPGRVKRDLIPNKTLGPVLVAGHCYEIRVSKQMRSANGAELEASFVQSFCASQPDRNSPIPEKWSVQAPSEKGQPLIVRFNESLNPSSILHYVSILDDQRNILPGYIDVSTKGDGFEFVPINGWKIGEYIVLIDSKLEDLAGNQLHRLFDSEEKNSESSDASSGEELRFHFK